MGSGFELLDPQPDIPALPAVQLGTADGWASLHKPRSFGLLFRNALTIRGLNSLRVIAFSKPERYLEATETLSCSYSLNASYHPRYRYARDFHALGDRELILVGERDESVDPEALRVIAVKCAPRSRFAVLPKDNHFGIFSESVVLDMMIEWLRKTSDAK